jgi:hypothetical protein
MKPLLSSLPLLFAFSLSAQAPVAVPAAKEPHHHLVLENSYVRVLRVSVPAHDATLLHQHDVPYIYVALGPGDVLNRSRVFVEQLAARLQRTRFPTA